MFNAWRTTWTISSRVGGCWSCVPYFDPRSVEGGQARASAEHLNVCRGGWVFHVQNGAILGAGYARLSPSLPGPPVLRGLLVGLIEHVATWPMTALVDRYHPARDELPNLVASRRAFAQATIRHAVFGIVLGLVEDTLNNRSEEFTL